VNNALIIIFAAMHSSARPRARTHCRYKSALTVTARGPRGEQFLSPPHSR
jgi:hypothetical protein